jgi:hypothetical protein
MYKMTGINQHDSYSTTDMNMFSAILEDGPLSCRCMIVPGDGQYEVLAYTAAHHRHAEKQGGVELLMGRPT